MILLDSNILINILREKERGKQWKDFLSNKSICISTITTFELFLGAELSKNKEKNLSAVKALIQDFPIIPFSIKASYISAKIYANLQKQGQLIESNDIYIASIALENNFALATDNVTHFQRIPNLELISL